MADRTRVEALMHVSSGRWQFGLFLALVTAVLWGILPIKLKEVLKVMDPITVTWFRLVVSGGLLLIYLAFTRQLPRFAPLGSRGMGLVLAAILGLTGNYVCYLIGLRMLTPGTTQLVIQIAPILLLLGSLFVFKESFSVGQALGLAVLIAGFGLFFNQRLAELFGSLGEYTTGVLIVVFAAFIWTFYGLAQKQL
ncbi:DMT family transporter, partial [Escherichia coli]